MADRVSASIVLGGTITAAAFAQLATLVEQDGLSTEWDGEPFQPDHITPDQPLISTRTRWRGDVSRRWNRGASQTRCRSPAGPAPTPASGAPNGSSSAAMESRHRSPPTRTTAF